MIRGLAHILAIVLLTILTQLGGIAWVAALVVRRLPFMVVFLAAYIALSLSAYAVAPLAGRVPMPCFAGSPDKAHSQSLLWCALNRHYVTPAVRNHANALAAHMNARHPGTFTRTLDGNFPFLDGFPLLPHLSHDDGAKLDLALWYADPKGRLSSPIGYFAFSEPRAGEPQPCQNQTGLTLRWDMGWIQPLMRDLPLDEARLRTALTWLADNRPPLGRVKVFVEPHLAQRLGVSGAAIRFQGCRAARHDDHIHIQIDGLP